MNLELDNDQCVLCNERYRDKLTHIVSNCTCTSDIRNNMYEDIARTLGIGVVNSLKALDPTNLYLRLLGAQAQETSDDVNLELQFLNTTHTYVLDCMVRCVENEISY